MSQTFLYIVASVGISLIFLIVGLVLGGPKAKKEIDADRMSKDLVVLNNNTKQAFKEIERSKRRLCFTPKENVRRAKIQLVSFLESGKTELAVLDLSFDNDDAVYKLPAKTSGVKVVVVSVNGEKLEVESVVNNKFIVRLICAIAFVLVPVIFSFLTLTYEMSINTNGDFFDMLLIPIAAPAINIVIFVIYALVTKKRGM